MTTRTETLYAAAVSELALALNSVAGIASYPGESPQARAYAARRRADALDLMAGIIANFSRKAIDIAAEGVDEVPEESRSYAFEGFLNAFKDASSSFRHSADIMEEGI